MKTGADKKAVAAYNRRMALTSLAELPRTSPGDIEMTTGISVPDKNSPAAPIRYLPVNGPNAVDSGNRYFLESEEGDEKTTDSARHHDSDEYPTSHSEMPITRRFGETSVNWHLSNPSRPIGWNS